MLINHIYFLDEFKKIDSVTVREFNARQNGGQIRRKATKKEIQAKQSLTQAMQDYKSGLFTIREFLFFVASLYEPIPIHDENLSSNSESECDDEDFQKLLSPNEPCDEIESNNASSSSAIEKSAPEKKGRNRQKRSASPMEDLPFEGPGASLIALKKKRRMTGQFHPT
jgi:hypothetical protein